MIFCHLREIFTKIMENKLLNTAAETELDTAKTASKN